jgi:hypothetical protein
VRFKEFGSKKNQKVDEFIPALIGAARLAGTVGTIAKGAAAVGGAALKGAQAVGGMVSKGAQAAASAAGKMTDAGKTATMQQQQRDMANTLKVGNTVSHPKMGDLKIKAVKGSNVELDTKNTFGQDVSVNKDELMSVVNPNTNQKKNPLATKSPGGLSQNVGGIAKSI